MQFSPRTRAYCWLCLHRIRFGGCSCLLPKSGQWAGLYPGFRLRPVFNCEIKRDKRQWIEGVHQAFSSATAQDSGGSASGQGAASGKAGVGAATCIFQDIAHIGGTVASCSVHGRNCPVPACNIFVCSTGRKGGTVASPSPVVGRFCWAVGVEVQRRLFTG